MTDRLTAEDAARLLEGTTPGPWWAKGRVGGQQVIDLVRELVDDDEAPTHLAQDLDLIAAAPALAAALADSVPRAEHERWGQIANERGRNLSFVAAERDAALAKVARLREPLLYQWESNHFEHCGRTWPHPEGKRCHWPQPPALAEGSDVRDQAVRNVDARHGYTCEFSTSPERHRQEYDDEEARLLAEGSDVLPTGGAE